MNLLFRTTSPSLRLLSALTLILGLLGANPASAQQERTPTGAGELWLEAVSDRSNRPSSPYADLVDAVGPAVVNIIVSYHDENLPLHLRHNPHTHSPDSLAQASGFFIHPEGYLLTNFHVVDHAHSVTVRLVDDRELDAEVVGVDPATDVALLKVRSDEALPTVAFGDSSQLRVGEDVIAIGNPMGLNNSVTAGIISAVGRRNLPIEGDSNQSSFIQTDAAINPGNSGGPLLNIRGDVIGMNTAVNRQGQGISFAIPINMIKRLLPQLKERGHVLRSWLGVRIQPIDSLLARSFDLEEARGALITEVLADSPASAAGLQEKDIILRLGQEIIQSSDHLPWLVSMTPAGTTVSVEVMREGSPRTIDVELRSIPYQNAPELPAQRASAASSTIEVEEGILGVEVATMTQRLARQLSAPAESGVVVTSLTSTSPLRVAGLRHRDVILEVAGTPMDNEDAFYAFVEDLPTGSVVRLKLLRRGRALYIAFTR